MSLGYIAGLVFAFVVLSVLGVYLPMIADQQKFSQRIARILKRKEAVKHDGVAFDSGLRGVCNPLYRWLTGLISTTPLKKWVERELTKADLPLREDEFLVFSLAGLGGVAIITMLVTDSILMTLMALMVFLPMPYLFIGRARKKRLATLNGQIGDALMFIANSLRSGFSFLQAMDLVRKEMSDPIAREFGRTFQEVNLGTHTEQALQNMVERVGSEELEMVITAVLIQRQVGGNLAEVLEKIAYTMQERIRIKGEIKTLTAQGRISGVVVGLLPVALGAFLFVVNPEYISLLFTSKIGLLMVGAALVAQSTGFLLIRRIVDIKY